MSNTITVKLRLTKDFKIVETPKEDGALYVRAISRGVDNKTRMTIDSPDHTAERRERSKWKDLRLPNWFTLIIYSHRRFLMERAAAELRKGTVVYVTGELMLESFTARNGKKYTFNKISVSNYSFPHGTLLQALNRDSLPCMADGNAPDEPESFDDVINSII